MSPKLNPGGNPGARASDKFRDLLVTTSVGDIERKIVWNRKKPLRLDHPQGWVISATKDGGLVFFDVSDTNRERMKARAIIIKKIIPDNKIILNLGISKGGNQNRPLDVTVRPLYPVKAPYMCTPDIETLQGHGPKQILVFQGLRYFMSDYRPVPSSFTVGKGGTALFSYQKGSTSFRIYAKAAGVKVKIGAKKKDLIEGIPLDLSFEEFFNSVFVYGVNWWRFKVAMTPDSLPPIEEAETDEDIRESDRLQFASMALGIICASGLAFAFLLAYFFPSVPHQQAPEVAIKAPRIIQHKEIKIVEKKPEPPPPVPPPPKPTEPKPPVVQSKPKPDPAPPKVAEAKPKLKPKKPPKVAKVEPPAPPPQAKLDKHDKNPAVKSPVKAAPGIVDAKPAPPPPPNPNAQMMKSLSFLSPSGKKPGVLSTNADYSKLSKKDVLAGPALGGGDSKANALDKISTGSTDTRIDTRSSRSISSAVGFGPSGKGKGKGLNDVQGKVSNGELYSVGGVVGGALGNGSGLSLSGSGQLSEAEIEKAIAKYLQKIQYCYEKSLLADQSLAGDLVLQWTITTSGSVKTPKVVKSQLKNEELHGCIMGILSNIPFPHARGGSVTVKRTFNFKSSTL